MIKRYLKVAEATALQKKIQNLVDETGIRVRVSYHPKYLQVPICEEDNNE
jgi:hypothetical protein